MRACCGALSSLVAALCVAAQLHERAFVYQQHLVYAGLFPGPARRPLRRLSLEFCQILSSTTQHRTWQGQHNASQRRIAQHRAAPGSNRKSVYVCLCACVTVSVCLLVCVRVYVCVGGGEKRVM